MIMEDLENLKGYFLVAHPKRAEPTLRKGVVLIIDHDHTGAIGLQINKPLENSTTLGQVMESLGMSLTIDRPLYFGGVENTNRIIVVHTLDWMSNTTIKLGENFGISNDLSVLAAIAQNQGPSLFRAVAGFTRWLPNNLESEIELIPPWNDISKSWALVEGTESLCFSNEGSDQWHMLLEESARKEIETWL